MEGRTNSLNVFLLGAVFNILASIDIASLVDYSLKAFIGGAIWLVFKILGDYMASKTISKKDGDGSSK